MGVPKFERPTTLAEEHALTLERSKYLLGYIAKQDEHIAHQEKDPLTGVFRREWFEKEFREALGIIRGEVVIQRAGETPLERISIIFVDLDHFKQINDKYGHSVGDDVLRKVGAFLTHLVRKTDMVARVGGEEFVVMLRGVDKKFAAKEAEIIRAEIKNIVFAKPELKITASLGVASSDDSTDPETLYGFADESMYKAKETRDSVVTYS